MSEYIDIKTQVQLCVVYIGVQSVLSEHLNKEETCLSMSCRKMNIDSLSLTPMNPWVTGIQEFRISSLQ
jgi:hypothetical protein